MEPIRNHLCPGLGRTRHPWLSGTTSQFGCAAAPDEARSVQGPCRRAMFPSFSPGEISYQAILDHLAARLQFRGAASGPPMASNRGGVGISRSDDGAIFAGRFPAGNIGRPFPERRGDERVEERDSFAPILSNRTVGPAMGSVTAPPAASLDPDRLSGRTQPANNRGARRRRSLFSFLFSSGAGNGG